MSSTTPDWLAAARAKGRPAVGAAAKKKRGKGPVRIGIKRCEISGREYACEVVPLGFLGKEHFVRYRDTVSGAGFKWDKEHRTNLGRPALVATLAKRLHERGFAVVVTSEVSELIEVQRRAVVQAVKDAEAQMRELDAAMEPKGMALFDYQRTAVLFLRMRAAFQRSALLGDDMGLGKTVEVLAAVPPDAPLLVVGPAKAKPVWRRHVAEWREDLECETLYGRGSFRFPQGNEVVVTNPAIIPKADFGNELAYGKVAPGTWLVIDEGEWVKNAQTQQGAAFMDLRSMVWNAGGFVLVVTATAVRNATGELFDVLTNIGCGDEAFGDAWRFADLMGGTKDIDNEGRTVWEWNEEDQHPWGIEQLREVCLRRTKELDIEQFVRTVWVELKDSEVEEQAARVLADFAAKGITLDDIAADLAPEQIYEAAEFKSLMKALNMAKIPAMLDHVERLLEEPENRVLIGSANRGPIEATKSIPLSGRIMGGVTAKAALEAEDAFQSGMLRALGATISAGGVAITLTKANHVVFCGEEHTDAANRQFIGRAVRTGQERDVWVWRIVADHPLEVALAKRLDRKRREFELSLGKSEVAHDWVPQLPEALAALTKAVDVEDWIKPKPKPRRGPADNVETWAIEQLVMLHGPVDPDDPENPNPDTQLEERDREFAGGMANTYRKRGTLTVNQWPWVLKTVLKYRKAVGPPPELVLEQGSLDPEADEAMKGREDDWGDDIPF